MSGNLKPFVDAGFRRDVLIELNRTSATMATTRVADLIQLGGSVAAGDKSDGKEGSSDGKEGSKDGGKDGSSDGSEGKEQCETDSDFLSRVGTPARFDALRGAIDSTRAAQELALQDRLSRTVVF